MHNYMYVNKLLICKQGCMVTERGNPLFSPRVIIYMYDATITKTTPSPIRLQGEALKNIIQCPW